MARKASTIKAHQLRVPYKSFVNGVNETNVNLAILYTLNTLVDLLIDVRGNQRTAGRILEEIAKKQGVKLPDDAKFPEVYKAEEHKNDGTSDNEVGNVTTE